MRLKQILLESVEEEHQLRKQILKIYKKILRSLCQKKVEINVDLAWKSIQHLYGNLLGSDSNITYDEEVVDEYGIHDAPSLAEVDLSDIFSSEISLDAELKFTVGEMWHGGVYYEPDNYFSTSISKDQSEIMRRFFSEVDREDWNDKQKFKEIVYDYICEEFPQHREIFLHEMVHFFKREMEEVGVRFQELLFVLEDKFEPENLRKRFQNFEEFKKWFFGEFVRYEEWGERISFDDVSEEQKRNLTDKLFNYWNWKIDD